MSKTDGDNILYHYFQKHLSNESNMAREFIEKLVTDLSIWLPTSLYKQIPILLPYVVRDSTCRKSVNKVKEEWGSADNFGFFRDDNSLIKGISKSFIIKSKKIKQYNNYKLGVGFISCHIWRNLNFGDEKVISNQHHEYNSFIPNIVWLPRQIAKLTDREDSVAQKTLQAISYGIYRNMDMPETILSLWDNLPCPKEYENRDIEIKKLNFFDIKEDWIKNRKNELIREINIITSLETVYDSSIGKVKCNRYLPSLIHIEVDKRKSLITYLQKYKEIISS